MCSRFDTIPACDRHCQTDGQTDGIAVASTALAMRALRGAVKLSLPMGGSGLPSNSWFLGPIQAHNPNGISIGSAVFAGLTTVTDRQTDRPRYSVGKMDHIYVRSTAMRPNNNNNLRHFYSAPQCSPCKRCTSCSNSVRLSSVCSSACHTPVLCQNDCM